MGRGLRGGPEGGRGAYGCPLLGGDTVRASGGLTISITAFGEVPAGGMVRRTSGRPWLTLAATGTIGDAALGLRLRLEPDAAWARKLGDAARRISPTATLHPRPRNAVAQALRGNAIAAMDISDGLLGDALKLARAALPPGEPASPSSI